MVFGGSEYASNNRFSSNGLTDSIAAHNRSSCSAERRALTNASAAAERIATGFSTDNDSISNSNCGSVNFAQASGDDRKCRDAKVICEKVRVGNRGEGAIQRVVRRGHRRQSARAAIAAGISRSSPSATIFAKASRQNGGVFAESCPLHRTKAANFAAPDELASRTFRPATA